MIYNLYLYIIKMNSLIIFQILDNYKHKPYYILNDYISINDDRFGRIVSFKLYEENNIIMADFKEAHRSFPLISSNYKTKNIESLEDFKNKWIDYYNFKY